MSYRNIWDFQKALPAFADAGASLHEVYAAFAGINDTESRENAFGSSAEWLRFVATRWSQQPDFVPVRLAELFDGKVVEHSDDYVLMMIGHLGGRWSGTVKSWFLREDDQLRDEIFWRIFEVEGGGEISLANIDKFSTSMVETWQDTVVTLSADGTLDRSRLLRSCLLALNRDFSGYRASWFSRTYVALGPTPAEAAADQDLLCASLATGITGTVGMAVKQLATVHKAGLLNVPEYLAACRPAFDGAKAHAAATVRLVTSLRDDADPEAVATAISAGLTHPHADIQTSAAKALIAMGRGDLVDDAVDILDPSVVRALNLGAAVDGIPLLDPSVDTAPAPPPEGATPLVPWSDDDALDRFAPLLEADIDVLEFDGALAWLAESSTSADILAPLVKRARKRLESPSRYAASVVLAVSDGGRFTLDGESLIPFFDERIREVIRIAKGALPRRPLLATPTDAAGWIDPSTLVSRYLDAVRSDVEPLPMDMIQALLRVGETDRNLAAKTLRSHGNLPAAGRKILRTLETGDPGSDVTDNLEVTWVSRSWDWNDKGTTRTMTHWWPKVSGEKRWKGRLAKNPGLIRSRSSQPSGHDADVSALAVLAAARPASTLPLVAVGLGYMSVGVDGAEATRADAATLAVLSRHPGRWSDITGQTLALGLSAKKADVRAIAAELFADAIPSRFPAADFAGSMAASVHGSQLPRWAGSLTDAASISPDAATAVVDVLAALLPRLDRTTRGIGKLMDVLHNEALRLRRPAADPALLDWLSGFTGSSAAARTATAILADA